MTGLVKKRTIAGVVAVLFAGLWISKQGLDIGNVIGFFFHGKYHWHQKMTLVVATPDGELSASSVVKVSGAVARGKRLDQFGAGASIVEGEAVALEVQPGRWLYLTLERKSVSDKIRKAARDQLGLMTSAEIIPMLPENASRLITFEDPLDPLTAVELDPNDFEATFGPGFALVDVRLEIVRDDVTEGGLGPVGEWIFNREPRALDGDRYVRADAAHPIANSLSALDFIRQQSRSNQ